MTFAAVLCSAIAGEALGQSVEGAVPRVVRFDGVWTPDGGPAAASAETVTLAIYDAPAGGTPLWEETQIVAVDAAGRYAVLVGASRPEGLSPGLLASPDPRWIEVRFARAAAAAPRVLLTSVPYALRAADADTLGGLPASAFLRAAPAEGVGDAAAGTGPAAATRAATPLVNTGTANYIGKFTNAIDLTSSVMFETSGRIGVGTTTPLDTVHARFTDPGGGVTGYAVQNLSSAANAYSGMLFYDHTGALRQFQGYNNSTGEYRINNIAPGASINFMLGSSSKFAVASSGNVGIGTSTPGDSLDVATGFVRSANGFKTVGMFSAGVSQELDSEIINIGINDGRTGPFVNHIGREYGFFRVDTRYGQPLFGWWHKAHTTGVEALRMSLSPSGVLVVPGVRTTGLSANSPVAVLVDSNGVMGIATSSRRYKDDIADMGDASNGLMRLRPVTFRYKDAGAGDARPTEYGLVAEEVAEVYPDLVAHLANGEVETVQYHKINAMLLNEAQKQHRRVEELMARVAVLERLLATAPK